MTGRFRVRFRFRIQKQLNISTKQHLLRIGERYVMLSGQTQDNVISDNFWLLMDARGFESEKEAKEFARSLKAACEVSSAAARLGLDAGIDRMTSGFGARVKDYVHEQQGILLRDNIHGIDVFQDDPNIRIGVVTASGKLLTEPDPFLSDLSAFYGQADRASPVTRDVVLLLNYALLQTEPVAQIVFALSAVEMLGQKESWTPDQKRLLAELARYALEANIGNYQERTEVAEAIKRGLYKLSLRQGVLRLLTSLGLENLRDRWDELYRERSTLVHGLAPRPGVRYDELARRVVGLCGRILLAVVAREVSGADAHIDRFYRLE
jgi:hypothetical protein